jgi:nucleoid-associated protein YgaU
VAAPQYRYNVYDAAGRLYESRVILREYPTSRSGALQADDLVFHNTGAYAGASWGLGYDAAGNLLGYLSDSRVAPLNSSKRYQEVTRYQYLSFGGAALQTQALTQRTNIQDANNATRKRNIGYDANGFVSQIVQEDEALMGRTFVNDAQGRTLLVNQGSGGGNSSYARVQNAQAYVGGWLGNESRPGHTQRQLVVNGEVMARYGDAAEDFLPMGQQPKFTSVAQFNLNNAPLNPQSTSASVSSYTVTQGESLRDIARTVLGDSSLWYRIAEANALGAAGDTPLQGGTTLKIPQVPLSANNADTFKPPDAGAKYSAYFSVKPEVAGCDVTLRQEVDGGTREVPSFYLAKHVCLNGRNVGPVNGLPQRLRWKVEVIRIP